MYFPQNNEGITLKGLCLQTVVKEVSEGTLSSSVLHKPNLWLPIALSQKVFDLCMNGAVEAEEVNNVVNHFLKDPSRTPLEKICFQNLRGVHVDLAFRLVKANLKSLTELDVRGCHTFSEKFWIMVNDAPKLHTLKTTKLEVELWCPNLTTLVVDWVPKKVVQRVQHHIRPKYYNKMLENVFPNLKHLDLSWCPWVNRLTALSKAKNLETLTLRNCNIKSIVRDVSQLTELRNLDISVGKELEDYHLGRFRNPQEVCDLLMNSLKKLKSINISGTNLDGCTLKSLPSCKVIKSNGLVVPMEVIKRNYNMPKTMIYHLRRLDSRSINTNLIDANMLLEVQMKLLKNLRHNEEHRDWALESTLRLLEYVDRPDVNVNNGLRMKLWPLVNRILFSHDNKKLPEYVLTVLFQIYFKLFPAGETVKVKDEETRKEILRLGKYMLNLRPSSYVFLKTETLHYRLLHRISVEPSVCGNISRNNAAVKSCIDFFASLQMYLGYSVSVHQAPHIVYDVWRTILNLINASSVGTRQFLKYRGLYWIRAHLSWFKNDDRTRTELCGVFRDILKRLDQDDIVEGERNVDISEAAKAVMNEIKSQI